MSVYAIIQFTISLILIFCSIFIAIWGISVDSKLSKATPEKYRIKKAFAKDKKTEEADFSNAWYYLVTLDSGEDELIRKRDYVSQSQTEIYVQSYKYYHQMYKEHKAYRSKEDDIAMLRPSKKSVVAFIICSIICFLSIGHAYEQRYSTESKLLHLVKETKVWEVERAVENYSAEDLRSNIYDSLIVEPLYALVSDDNEIDACLQDIYLCDAILMWINESDFIAQPPDVNNPFSKWVLAEKYMVTEEYIHCLQDLKTGKITKEEAKEIAEEIEQSFLQTANRVMFLTITTWTLLLIGWIGSAVFVVRISVYVFRKRKFTIQTNYHIP